MKHWILATVLATTTSVWAAPDWTKAQIVKIDSHITQVVLEHERVKRVSMDATTMPFEVNEAVKLDVFMAGQSVRFTVAERNSYWIIDRMEPVQ